MVMSLTSVVAYTAGVIAAEYCMFIICAMYFSVRILQ